MKQFCLKDPIDPTKTLRINTFSKDAERKNQYIKVFKYTNNKLTEKEIRENISFILALPKTKYSGINKPNQGSERLLSAMKTSIHCKKTKTTH